LLTSRVTLYTDESRSDVALTWHGLRQQTEKQGIDGVTRPSRCLADFVAPKGTGVNDYVGRIGEDQLEDLARRKGMARDEVARLVGANLQGRLPRDANSPALRRKSDHRS